jgi:iron complex transport system ATP-binding protein
MTALRWTELRLDIAGRRVLDGVTLHAARGEVLGIVGPNGAGKTALLRCAAGLAAPTGGSVALDGPGGGPSSPRARARQIAFLPQAPETAWPIPVAAAVALGRLPHDDRGATDADDRAVAAALAAVGLATLAQRRIDTLSGGERARVLLARALAVEAPILLLDEPCAALDPRQQLAAMALFRRLAGAGNCLCVVLHDLALAARFCDRVAVLDRGRLVAVGPPDAALDDATLAAVYGLRAWRGRVDDADLLVPWALASGPQERWA